MSTKQAYLRIRGKVQGVFYRATALQMAQRLALTGWVRNLPDGSVECVVEGPEHDILQFIDWAHRGPAYARVDSVQVSWADFSGAFASFDCRK